MFRINGKNRKKAYKEKLSKNDKYQQDTKNTIYKEEINEVILNDLVPQDKKSEYGLDERDSVKSKKSGKLKLNLGIGNKKTNSKSSNKSPKTSKKNQDVQEKQKTSSNEIENKHNNKKNKKNKNSDKKIAKSTKKNKYKSSNKLQTDKKNKNEKNNKLNEEKLIKKEKNHKKISKKSKQVKSLNEQSDTYTQQDENKDFNYNYVYISENNNITFNRKDDTSNCKDIDDIESTKEKHKSRFEDIVWSEEKFPQKKN